MLLNSIDEWFVYFDNNRKQICKFIKMHSPNKLNDLIEARDNNDYFLMFKIIQDIWLEVPLNNININKDLEGWQQLNVLLNNILYK